MTDTLPEELFFDGQCLDKGFEFHLKISFDKEPRLGDGLVNIHGQILWTVEQPEMLFCYTERSKELAETEMVRGTFCPQTRELFFVGKRRSGVFPRFEMNDPPCPVDFPCTICDCKAYHSLTNRFPCGECYHSPKQHNYENQEHIIACDTYAIHLPKVLTSEPFEGKTKGNGGRWDNVITLWNSSVCLKPAK